MLNDMQLLPVYDSAEHDLVRGLQVPLLKHSNEYLRGVGFFTSGWLRIAAEGMSDFVARGGRARFVVSPVLEAGDWEALQVGEAARLDEKLRLLIEKHIDELSASLERDTLSALAWMVADGVLEFRFALPRAEDSRAAYHDKVGVFRDAGGFAVVLHGSLNDSVQGSLNGEAFSVFQSWVPGQQPYAEKHIERLEALWADANPQFRVCRIPDAVRERFIQLRGESSRPYSLTSCSDDTAAPNGPSCTADLRPYQQAAIDAWIAADCRGVFEMATGTGKTITALAAAADRYSAIGHLAVIVLVPYLHLLEQWARDCRAFGFSPVLCSGNHDGWQIEVKSRIQDFNMGVRSDLCIVAVHMTAASDRFRAAIGRLKPEATLVIGDEAHGLGARHLQNAMTDRANLRLGLSATPRRWYDEGGTSAIIGYFGNTCFEFPLEEAVGTYLTPYRYYPQPVSLTDEELEEYEALTARITILARSPESTAQRREEIKMLLLRRARGISSAQAKLPAMLSLLKRIVLQDKTEGRETSGILVYCAAGTHQEVLRAVGDLGLRCHEFVHYVSLSGRERLLRQFANGDIQALIAVKCLDEGVDVPATKTAFVMASSTNPREFVQRRGRILRLSPGKREAVMCRYMALPLRQQVWPSADARMPSVRPRPANVLYAA